jgi:hypothetical protein
VKAAAHILSTITRCYLFVVVATQVARKAAAQQPCPLSFHLQFIRCPIGAATSQQHVAAARSSLGGLSRIMSVSLGDFLSSSTPETTKGHTWRIRAFLPELLQTRSQPGGPSEPKTCLDRTRGSSVQCPYNVRTISVPCPFRVRPMSVRRDPDTDRPGPDKLRLATNPKQN